jgi:hypothetical protein
MNASHRRIAALLLTALICTVPGCYTVNQDGNVTVASFSGTVLTVLSLVTLAGIAIGVLMCRREGYWEKGVIVAGVATMFAIFVLPGIFLDEVRMDEQGVHQRTGFWFLPTRKGFDYSELKSVSVTEVQKRRTVETQWTLYLKNGQTRVLDPGDLWDQCAAEVIEALTVKGIPVQIQ